MPPLWHRGGGGRAPGHLLPSGTAGLAACERTRAGLVAPWAGTATEPRGGGPTCLPPSRGLCPERRFPCVWTRLRVAHPDERLAEVVDGLAVVGIHLQRVRRRGEQLDSHLHAAGACATDAPLQAVQLRTPWRLRGTLSLQADHGEASLNAPGRRQLKPVLVVLSAPRRCWRIPAHARGARPAPRAEAVRSS